MKIKDTESAQKNVEEYMKIAESNEDFKLSLQLAHLWADAMESNLEEIRNGDSRLFFALYLL